MSAFSASAQAVIHTKRASTMWQIPLLLVHNYTDLFVLHRDVDPERSKYHLEIEVFYVLRIFLNKIATWLYIVAHQRIKNRIRQNRILNANL
jgi:hypothetical protein